MKYIGFFVFILLCTNSYGQGYQPLGSKTNTVVVQNGFSVPHFLFIPNIEATDSGNIRIHNGVLQFKNGSTWANVGSDTSNIDSAYFDKITVAKDTGSYNSGTYDYVLNGIGSINRTEIRRNFARPVALSMVVNANPTSPPAIAVDYHGFDISGNAGRKTNNLTRIYPFESTARFDSDTANELGKMVGGYFQSTNIGLGTVLSSVNLRLRYSNTGGGHVNEAIGAHFESPINTGGGMTDNYYAIKVDPIAAATNNYGIYSNTYNNYFAGIQTGSTGIKIDGSSTGSSTVVAQVAGTDVVHRMPVNGGTLALASEVLAKASPVWTSRATGELMTISRTDISTVSPTLAPLNVDITGSPASAPASGLDLKAQETIHRTTGSNTNSFTRSYPLRVISTNSATSILGQQIAVTGLTNNTSSGNVNTSTVFQAGLTNSGSGSLLDWKGFNIPVPTISAGSVSKITALNVGAINNSDTVFSVYSLVPKGIWRWNLFLGGNAPNYINGKLSLGTIDTSKQLSILGGFTINASSDSILFTTNGQYGSFETDSLTANRVYQFPNNSGRLVLSSELANKVDTGTAVLVGGNTVAATLNIGTNTSQGIGIRTNGSSRMTVSSTGDIGILTATNTTAGTRALVLTSANVVRSIPLDTFVNSSATTLTLSTKGYWSFTGTSTTWTLPAMATNIGTRYFLANKGSANITLNTPTNTLWESGVVSSSTTIAPGETVQIYNDALHWTIYN